MKDVMIDLETLGTAPGCVVLSIGAVLFDPDLGVVSNAAFHRPISLASCLTAGLTINPDTVAWWARQSPQAQTILWDALSTGYTLGHVLSDFGVWLDNLADHIPSAPRADKLRLWGNGAGFDQVILAAACRAAEISPPWNGFNDRCFRTEKAGWKHVEPPREGVHHDALDDARHQARWLCEIRRAQRRPLVEGQRLAQSLLTAWRNNAPGDFRLIAEQLEAWAAPRDDSADSRAERVAA